MVFFGQKSYIATWENYNFRLSKKKKNRKNYFSSFCGQTKSISQRMTSSAPSFLVRFQEIDVVIMVLEWSHQKADLTLRIHQPVLIFFLLFIKEKKNIYMVKYENYFNIRWNCRLVVCAFKKIKKKKELFVWEKVIFNVRFFFFVVVDHFPFYRGSFYFLN